MKSVMTPLDFLARSAFVYREKLAVVDGPRRFTYLQFDQRVRQLADGLTRVGVCPGDRVAVLSLNTVMALESHFAVPLVGGVLVMLDVRLRAAELAWILNHCGATALMADPELLTFLRPMLEGLKHMAFITDDYEALVEEGDFSFRAQGSTAEDDLISINYTSGTTGVPKGVMYSYRGAYLNSMSSVMEFGLDSRSVYLWTLPMFHCNGWCFPWAVTAVGGTHLCLREADPEEIVRQILTEHATVLCGSPALVGHLSDYCADNKIHFQDKLRIVIAGAPPSPAVLRAGEEMGAEVTHVYGLTETYGPHAVCAWRSEWNRLPSSERARLKARQGVPGILNGTNMRVVNENMEDVPADGVTMGEVVMCGNNVMLGYYRNPEATAEAFQGGWFHSGDIAVMHPDGYIEITDRAKDIVVSGGENVCSLEVERVLHEHPAVLEVAVIACPDKKWGEIPKAHVLLKSNCEVTAAELIEFCRERLAEFKCPKLIEFGPMPRTATGKVRKNELRERAWVEQEEGVG